ncbi:MULTISPECIES: nitroreductase family protein [unclassified Streptomyces]|uniref:nitroreductase family protein n=1 Tax=unclassified Streptomyces TaxID=2593676 RepID=UPI0033B599DD
MPLIPLDEAATATAERVRRRAPFPAAAPDRRDSAVGTLTPGARSLDEVLEGRKSVREFTDVPVARSTLLAVLDRAAAAQRRQWPADRYGDPVLQLIVAARHVEGLSKDLYAWSADGKLRPLGVPCDENALAGDYTDAPAYVFVCGSVRRVGPDALAGQMFRAGSAGYAVWLAARTHGLECSAFGAAHAPVRSAAAAVQAGARHLFTVAIGHAHDSVARP